MVAAGEFLEHAQVFDNCYGTPRDAGRRSSSRQGDNVLLEIDWQGAQQIRRAMPECRHDLRAAALARRAGAAPARPRHRQ